MQKIENRKQEDWKVTNWKNIKNGRMEEKTKGLSDEVTKGKKVAGSSCSGSKQRTIGNEQKVGINKSKIILPN